MSLEQEIAEKRDTKDVHTHKESHVKTISRSLAGQGERSRKKPTLPIFLDFRTMRKKIFVVMPLYLRYFVMIAIPN